MLVNLERVTRVVLLSLGLFVLSQMWAQLVMEIQVPLAREVGPLTAVPSRR